MSLAANGAAATQSTTMTAGTEARVSLPFGSSVAKKTPVQGVAQPSTLWLDGSDGVLKARGALLHRSHDRLHLIR